MVSPTNFEQYGADPASPEKQEWKQLLNAIPDDPIELGKIFDQADPNHRNRVQELAETFALSHENGELQAGIAHELGHAIHCHDLQKDVFSALYVFCFELLLFRHLADPIYTSITLAGSAIAMYATDYGTATVPGFWFSRYAELEADREVTISPEYVEGHISYFKKRLIWHLAQTPSGSCERVIRELLGESDIFLTHPNPAKRLRNAVQLRGKPYKAPSPLSSIGRGAIASIPLLLAARDVYNIAQAIFQYF